MELYEFREEVYGKYQNRLFKLESSWDSFRPIDGIAWNGTKLVTIDSEFKKDILSPTYGFGSTEMKKICQHLTDTTDFDKALPIQDPVSFWKWAGQATEWWRDRPIVFESSCVSRSPADWKRYLTYLQTKPKTLRRTGFRRATKRLVPK